jgi:hypothetical protein
VDNKKMTVPTPLFPLGFENDKKRLENIILGLVTARKTCEPEEINFYDGQVKKYKDRYEELTGKKYRYKRPKIREIIDTGEDRI